MKGVFILGARIVSGLEKQCLKIEEELLFGVTDVDVTEKDDAKSRFHLLKMGA